MTEARAMADEDKISGNEVANLTFRIAMGIFAAFVALVVLFIL